MILKQLYPILAFMFFMIQAQGQSSNIFHRLEKLKVLGTALYVAAHPDDENTRMISHLSNKDKVRTVYLSLTRGDGGQNLIGPQLGSQLGVIRTQELLAARRIDGGEQWFSRANDFGYSKTPEETLDIWENEEVLADVVWAIRKFKPDVIINRFNHERTRSTHGHHTASAMLSYKAFDLAGDPNIFPEQLKYVDVWQPARLYFNTSWWFYGSREKFEEADKTDMAEVDIGSYYPVLGSSNNEIAAQSRSQHKCQGFGAQLQRGSQMEYLQWLKGEKPSDKNDIFEGIELTWSRVKGGKKIDMLLDQILADYKVQDPSAIVPQLLELRALIRKIDNDHWKNIKLRDLDEIIKDCLGLYMEAYTTDEEIIPGMDLAWTLELVNRSPWQVKATDIQAKGIVWDTTLTPELGPNIKYEAEFKTAVLDSKPTTPYWINEKATLGMYYVPDQTLVGKPEAEPTIGLNITLDINGQSLASFIPIVHKHIDPVKGEITTTAPVSGGLSLEFGESVTIFRAGASKTITVKAKAYQHTHTDISLRGNEGWTITPAVIHLDMNAGETRELTFQVQAPESADRSTFTIGESTSADIGKTEIRIEFDHIPTQQIILPAEATFICSEINFADRRIGYLEGAGDDVAESLQQVGYQIANIPADQINQRTLSQFDVIIVGIRAFNTVDELENGNRELFQFAENGGTVIVQYNTSRRLVTDDVAPLPLTLSRDRVTNEHSPVSIVLPQHIVMNQPNKITSNDFDGWVQERGLYFPDEWDEKYAAPLEMNDPEEDPTKGSLLIARYGRGYYVYSGLSWFRQLPAGVEGAYKLFANLIALKQTTRP